MEFLPDWVSVDKVRYSLSKLERDPRVEAMPVYPYTGSVQKIDDFLVVKLG